MSKIRIAYLFGDVQPGGASGLWDYDNSSWGGVLGNIPRVPLENKLTDEQIALWCRSHNIDILLCTLWATHVAGTGKSQRGILTLKEQCPDLKVIGLVDEPLMVDWCSRFGGNAQQMAISKGYVDGLADCDAILTICKHEIPFYSSFNEHVYHVGLPFPDTAYPVLIRNEPRPEKKDNIWIGLGVGGNAFTRWERNYLVALEAFEKAVAKVRQANQDLADRMRGVMLSWTEKSQRDVLGFIKDKYPNVLIQLRTDMKDYLHFLQSCDAVISPIVRDTPGRLVGECAFFEIPLFGSSVPDIQYELYPATTYSPWDVNAYADGVAEFVLNEEVKKQRHVEAYKAKCQLIKEYGFENSRKKFVDVLTNLGWSTDWFTEEDQSILL